MKYYRPDIDGLRAVAVLSVLLFHAHVPGVDSGFVGVDVFFVISGFLISGIILREGVEKRFSFARFYERRVRRILPPLLVVLVATTFAAGILMAPSDLVRYAKFLAASICMIPNIAAWEVTRDYFAPQAAETPLLHLWSLGIEEQFYLIFPTMLLLLIHYVKMQRHRIVIAAFAVFSFFIAIWSAYHMPEAGFYLLPSRAWELMLGALLSYTIVTPSKDQQTFRPQYLETVSVLGALLMLAGIVLPNRGQLQTAWMHQAAGAIGAALIIFSGSYRETAVHRILSRKLPVKIGLISYSLYLWHWPLLSLLAYYRASDFPSWYPLAEYGMLGLSFLLALLSWQFVETPYRNRQAMGFKPVLLSTAAVQVCLLLAVGLAIKTEGLPSRYSDPRELAYLKGVNDINPLRGLCYHEDISRQTQIHFDDCAIGASDKPRSFLLWGDSHADAITPAFDLAGKRKNVSGIVASFSGGAALLGAARKDKSTAHNNAWQLFNQKVLDYLGQTPNITKVFLVGRWTAYALGHTDYEGDRGGTISFAGKNAPPKEALRLSLIDTITKLQALGKQVYIVATIPEADRNVPNWLARHAVRNVKDEDVWIKGYPQRRRALIPMFEALSRTYGVKLIIPDNTLCRSPSHNASECLIAADGKSLYFDDDHLSATGARKIAGIFEQALEPDRSLTSSVRQ